MRTTPDELLERIEDTRGFVQRILTGEISAVTDPLLFVEGDDTLFHALFFLDVNDHAWLDAQLADELYPEACRELVRRQAPKSVG